jgi:membrane-associated phospholipid phosphatase
LRFWTLPFDANLGVWLRDQDRSLPSILAACEFAAEHAKWRFDTDQALIDRGWLTRNDHLGWQSQFDPFITGEIAELFDLMEDDRDRYMGEINVQADGLAAYIIAMLGIDGERRPWTLELIRCGLAIGNIFYMNYKQHFRRVRPSFICPGLVTPFGPPRHPAFPSGHSFLGHFIALLLLEIPQVAIRFGEPSTPGAPPNPLSGGVPVAPAGPLRQALLSDVMQKAQDYVFTGPLLWLATRLAKNRERAGVHYPSDSLASRWMAGAVWALLTKAPIPPTTADPDPIVPLANPARAVAGSEVRNSKLIVCPTLRRVLNLACAEWL